MNFMSKADTLSTLEGKLESAMVLPQYFFTVGQWQEDAATLLEVFYAQHSWAELGLVVRSSSLAEDGEGQSLAGHFDSVLNVCGPEALNVAIEVVIGSFGQATLNDQVFIPC
jgi:hypothetical protein